MLEMPVNAQVAEAHRRAHLARAQMVRSMLHKLRQFFVVPLIPKWVLTESSR